MTSLGI